MLSDAAPPDAIEGASIFSVTARRSGAERVVTPRGELDVATAGQLVEALNGELGGVDVIVDLAQLSFCDCAGLDVLLTAHEQQRAYGARLLLTNPTSSFRRLLSLTELDAHFDIGIGRS